MSLENYVTAAVALQFSDSVGKPFQPEENDSFVIQASSAEENQKFEVILGKPSDQGLASAVVMRIYNGDEFSALACRRLAMTNTWVIVDKTQLFGEYPETDLCPAELNSMFNWAFAKFYNECTSLCVPAWTQEGYVNSPIPTATDSAKFKADLEAQRRKEEKEAEEKYLAEEKARREAEAKLRAEEEAKAARRAVEYARYAKEQADKAAAFEKARLEQVEQIRSQQAAAQRLAEEKALSVKLENSKKWFMKNLFNKNFDRTQTFGSQMFDKFVTADLEIFNTILADAQIGKSHVEAWWNEYKTNPINF